MRPADAPSPRRLLSVQAELRAKPHRAAWPGHPPAPHAPNGKGSGAQGHSARRGTLPRALGRACWPPGVCPLPALKPPLKPPLAPAPRPEVTVPSWCARGATGPDPAAELGWGSPFPTVTGTHPRADPTAHSCDPRPWSRCRGLHAGVLTCVVCVAVTCVVCVIVCTAGPTRLGPATSPGRTRPRALASRGETVLRVVLQRLWAHLGPDPAL